MLMTEQNRRLGELLLAYHLINQQQLNEARRMQDQSGERLGSILVEMDYLTVDALLESLSRQYGLPTANLFKLSLDPKVLRILPLEKIKKYQALPVSTSDHKIKVAMVNPNDMATLRELQFILGMSVQPLITPSFQFAAALKLLEKIGGIPDHPLEGSELARQCPKITKHLQLPTLKELFHTMLKEQASDLLLVAGVPPSLKKNNELVRLPAPTLTPQQVGLYAKELMTQVQLKRFVQEKELDFAKTYPDLGRFRVNVYKQRNSFSIAIRHIIEDIPSPKKLLLPPWIENYALKQEGLILITGPTGHGKTTTLAAMVDIINTKRRRNIITIEDPIEYLHRHKSSNVNQREVGLDTDSFGEGLRHIFREAPDVIVIGEMRDPESFAIALEAADTGHLVLSCLHSNNAILAINRIIDVFPPEKQQQIRVQMADNFRLILSQRLVTRSDGQGRILAYEKLSNSYRIKNLIREGKEHQIRGLLQQSMDDFISLDVSLANLVNEKRVTFEAALQFCQDESFFREMVTKGVAALKKPSHPEKSSA